MADRRRKPESLLKIAGERMEILFGLAGKEAKKHPGRSRRYIELARKIGMRYNVRMPKEMRRQVCRKCNSLLVPGFSCRIRMDGRKTVIVTCLHCGSLSRYPYIAERKNTKKVI